MIIKDKIVLVYDIEVFPNVFSCTLKNSETDEVTVFEISHRIDNNKAEIGKLVALFKDSRYLFCGYNNIHYDNPIINFIIANYNTVPGNYFIICNTLNKLSNTIIHGEKEQWKQWKYANNFATLDLLTMLFSQKLRVGLKEMQVTMQYPNVQEYSLGFDSYLLDEDIPEMLSYNLNDVNSTLELLNRCKKEIELRLGIEKEFGVDVLSKDGMTIGTEILKTKYLEKTGKSWYDIKDLRSPCDVINLSNVIFPIIHFETKLLQDFLEEFKQQKVGAGRKAYEKHFLFGDTHGAFMRP